MKILIVSRDFPKIFGGVSDYTYHLSKALVREKIEVVVLTSNDDRVKKDGEVRVLPLIGRWNFFAIPRILRTVRDTQPDVVSLQYVPYMYNYYGVPLYITILAVALRMMGSNLVTTFHDIAIRFNWRKPKYWGIATLQRLIAFVLALSSNKIIVSNEFDKQVLKSFRRRAHLIPVGSNITPVTLSSEGKAELRAKIAPSGETIIATFGSGSSWRRTDLLLQAINLFTKKSGRSVKVLIIGSQGDSANKSYHDLKHLVDALGMENAVYITGYLEDVEVFKYLSVADLFVLLDTGAHGGVSTKSTSLASAYAAGLPIIGNKGIQTADFLKDGENIYLLDSLEPHEFYCAISSLIEDKLLNQHLAKGSGKTYRENLTWEKIAKDHLKALGTIGFS